MSEYIGKTVKTGLYRLKNNRVALALMFVMSICILIVWDEIFTHKPNYAEPYGSAELSEISGGGENE